MPPTLFKAGRAPIYTPPELYSLNALTATTPWNSCNRAMMAGNHFGQRLITIHNDEKRVQSGADIELGKYTFCVKMPADGVIKALVDRYPNTLSADSIPGNPETLVIYETDGTREIGCFLVPKFLSYHQYFGYRLKPTDEMKRLRPGEYFKAGTVFADSPAKGAHGSYRSGVELKVALMSYHAVAEDAFVISESAAKKLATRVYETRIIKAGGNRVLLNKYGTAQHYQPIPEIGQEIGEDGLLAVIRTLEPLMAPVQLSVPSLMQPNLQFDEPVYVRGPGGKVVDIKVYHDENSPSLVPPRMTEMLNRYGRGLKRYHAEILSQYERIVREQREMFRTNDVNISEPMQRVLTTSLAIAGKDSSKVTLLHRGEPLADYQIVVTVEYLLYPKEGFKITDGHGGSI